jgi:hypothetical protein
MSAWIWGLLVVGTTVCLAIGGMLLVRRSVTLSTLESHNQVAGFIYSVVGVVYAVLLAFIAIVVWQQHTSVQTQVEQEANQLGDLYRNAQVFPAEVRTRLQNQIRAYSRIVVEKEWPAMAKREASADAWAAFNQLWRAYQQVEARNDYESVWYAKSLDRLDQLGDYRRLRLLSNRPAVPAAHVGGAARDRDHHDWLQLFLRHAKQLCPSAHDCCAVSDYRTGPVLDLGLKSSFRRFGSG